MIFQKKQKVNQYLGNSFKDFNEDYENLTKNMSLKFKHMRQQGEMESQQQSLSSIQKNESQRRLGNTCSSQNLDTFVQKSPWAEKASYQKESDGKPQSESLQPKLITNQARRASIKKSSHSMTPKNGVRESFFFSTVSRFTGDDDNFKMIAYPDRYSNKNFMVCERNDIDPKYFDSNFSAVRHTNTNSMMLSMCNQGSPLMTPAQKLDQLLEIKQEQKQFQNWKQEYSSMNKRYRVHKGMYPSGILQVDHPYNAESQLYFEEAKKEINKQARKQKFNQLHQQRIAVLERSNPQIEFMNSYSRTQLRSEDSQKPVINNLSNRFQSQYDMYNPNQKLSDGKTTPFSNTHRERLSVQWTCKRPVTTNIESQGKDTQDRLFGAEAKNYSLVRAKYLREQDTKSRNFNVISFADNKIDFKQDQGIQSTPLTTSVVV